MEHFPFLRLEYLYYGFLLLFGLILRLFWNQRKIIRQIRINRLREEKGETWLGEKWEDSLDMDVKN